MIIIMDSNEQTPFSFATINPRPIVIRQHLKTGDYSIQGYENKISVERKSLPDFIKSLGKDHDRVEREIIRGADMDFFAVVIEADWPVIIAEIKCNHPKMSSKAVFASCIAWAQRYKTHFYPCPSRAFAEKTCYRILERFHKDNNEK